MIRNLSLVSPVTPFPCSSSTLTMAVRCAQSFCVWAAVKEQPARMQSKAGSGLKTHIALFRQNLSHNCCELTFADQFRQSHEVFVHHPILFCRRTNRADRRKRRLPPL